MRTLNYIMEDTEETCRLEIKTDFKRLENQARWAGIQKGMHVLDVGCGSGITTSYLKKITGNSGSVTGIDASNERIQHAEHEYSDTGIRFVQKDIYDDLSELGTFDFIWVRFFLEYHRSGSTGIVERLTHLLKPGGILCLVDLDYNVLTHHELSARLQNAITGVVKTLQERKNFDPYAGRKLYSYVFDQKLANINVMMQPHHLIYGELSKIDAFNWTKKLTVAAKHSGYTFPEYTDGWDGFCQDFSGFFNNPRRFTYTPLIACRGEKQRENSRSPVSG